MIDINPKRLYLITFLGTIQAFMAHEGLLSVGSTRLCFLVAMHQGRDVIMIDVLHHQCLHF